MKVSADHGKKPTNKSPRHRARELVMQGIYQWRISGSDAQVIVRQMQAEENLGRYDKDMFVRLLLGSLKLHVELGGLLAPHLDRSLDELSPVEFSVLLLGAFELSQQPEVPYKVVINEAVELAKTFGGTDGHKYINGVLDKLALQSRALEINGRN